MAWIKVNKAEAINLDLDTIQSFKIVRTENDDYRLEAKAKSGMTTTTWYLKVGALEQCESALAQIMWCIENGVTVINLSE